MSCPSSSSRRALRLLVTAATLAATAAAAHAQADSTPPRPTPDSARRLDTVRVTVTRAAANDLARVPWAVDVVEERALRRGQPTIGLDEALGAVPGVYVANRFNFAVDQRVAIRGFGARANFGLRGLTVLLDGVPQTLPDGQSQLTNLELGAVSRVEVLRGASSALWGNGSGGVLAFETDMSAPARLQQTLRTEGGAFGLRKSQLRTAGRAGNAIASLSLSRLTTDGFRQYAAADVRQLNAGLDYALGSRTTAMVRAHAADMPRAENPGALTFAEWRANPDSASRFNVFRGADKRVRQQQLALGIRRGGGDGGGGDGGGLSSGAMVWAVRRDLRNAIAAPPPDPNPALLTEGTYVTIDRDVLGARFDAARAIGRGASAPRLSVGVDAQRMRDDRRNRRVTGGRPTATTDTLILHQLEMVTSVGPFAQLAWTPAARVRLDSGARWDRIAFDADDRFVAQDEGRDESGERALTARSGHLGASLLVAPWLATYVNTSTSFETPTTTELQTQPGGGGGFAGDLGPQRARAIELGARGVAASRLTWSAALFAMRIDDAIVQFQEVGGRAYFRNAARTNQVGAELSGRVRVAEALAVEGAYTWSRFRFGEYRVARGTTVDTLDGRRLPGVPPRTLRVGVRGGPARRGPLRGVTLDLDHTATSALWADDANLVRVPGWGRGLLNARAAWSGTVRGMPLEPFVGVLNALDQPYVAAVTVNGANGRVLEPGTPRALYAGLALGWRIE